MTRPGWRDPRLWIGVLLVAGSVVAGARLFAAADDTVAVWAMAEERGAGTPVVAEDLVVTRVRFSDGDTLDRYYSADDAVPADIVLTRPVGSGELLARTSTAPQDEETTLQLPLAVDPQRVPPDVGTGSVVDVWLTDGSGRLESPDDAKGDSDAGSTDTDGPALSAVTVVAAPSYDETFAVSGTRQIVVSVDEEIAAEFERLLGSMQTPQIRVLQRS